MEKANLNIIRLGMIFGFLITLLGMLGGLLLIYLDKSAQGFSLILGALATLIGSFIFKRIKK